MFCIKWQEKTPACSKGFLSGEMKQALKNRIIFYCFYDCLY